LGSTPSRGFVISHPQFTFEMVLEELSALHIHEEIIPDKMEELVEKIPHDRIWIHPIIVDRNSLVVLDGMHRVAAAKEIGYRYIPVCLVDYMNPNIHIGCWYRMFKTLGLDEARKVLTEAGLTPAAKTYDEAHSLVEGRKAVTAIFSDTWCLAATGTAADIKAKYEAIKRVENALQAKGHHIGYNTDEDAPVRVASGEYAAGLMTPTVTKKEVVDTALNGMVFSQKTTRHIIPARPMFVSVPTDWLKGDLTPEEANARLRKHLTSKRVEKLPPGQIIDRRYDEELYVFKSA
jgi:L-serine kinase (ADP)